MFKIHSYLGFGRSHQRYHRDDRRLKADSIAAKIYGHYRARTCDLYRVKVALIPTELSARKDELEL